MVVDAETGSPLAGAAVAVEEKGQGTYTDETGHFMLMNAPEPPLVLVVNMVGYEENRVELDAIPSHLSVGLSPSTVTTGEVEVTASPALHDMSQSPIPTQKLDASRIESANQTSVLDAVRLLPGVTVSGGQSSGASDAFNPMLQGLLPQHTLVLLDNKRLFCHDGSGSNISSVPLLLVDRIEVIEGASCAIHGSDALGGIINIITTKPSPRPLYAFRVNYGTYGNLEAGAAIGGPGPFGSAYILSLGQRAYDGRQGAEAYRRQSASVKSTWKAFRLNGDYSQGDAGTDLPDRFWNTIAEAGASWMSPFSHNDVSGYFNHYYRTYGSGSASDNALAEVKAESHIVLSWHNLMVGSVFRENQFERTGLSLLSESFYGLYFEDDARPSGWLNLDVAGRVDRYPVGGLQLTPKAGLRLKPAGWFTLRAYLGRGFRAPSLQDRYEEIVPASSYYRNGNPSLLPEASISYSSGMDIAVTGFLTVGISGFFNSLTNMITPAPTGDSLNGLPIFTWKNTPSAYTWGVSLKASLEKGPLSGDVAYTYLNARDAATGLPLAYEPKHTVSGQLTLEYGGAGASLTGEWVKDRLYSGAIRLPDYTLLNLNLFAKPLNGVQVNFGIQNLLDQEFFTYEEGNAPPSPGRTLSGGINMRF